MRYYTRSIAYLTRSIETLLLALSIPQILEQAAYASEGVDVAAITFENNQPCVDLLERKPIGILPMLDELCFLGRESTTDGEVRERGREREGERERESVGGILYLIRMGR